MQQLLAVRQTVVEAHVRNAGEKLLRNVAFLERLQCIAKGVDLVDVVLQVANLEAVAQLAARLLEQVAVVGQFLSKLVLPLLDLIERFLVLIAVLLHGFQLGLECRFLVRLVLFQLFLGVLFLELGNLVKNLLFVLLGCLFQLGVLLVQRILIRLFALGLLALSRGNFHIGELLLEILLLLDKRVVQPFGGFEHSVLRFLHTGGKAEHGKLADLGEHLGRAVNLQQTLNAVHDAGEETADLASEPACHRGNTLPDTLCNLHADGRDRTHQTPERADDRRNNLRHSGNDGADNGRQVADERHKQLHTGACNLRRVGNQCADNSRDNLRQGCCDGRNNRRQCLNECYQQCDTGLHDLRHVADECCHDAVDDLRQCGCNRRDDGRQRLHECSQQCNAGLHDLRHGADQDGYQTVNDGRHSGHQHRDCRDKALRQSLDERDGCFDQCRQHR